MKTFDIYSKTFGVRINQSKKFQTKIGALASILTFIIFTLAFIAFGMDLFKKTHPKITIQEQLYKNEEVEVMNSTNIPENKTIVIQAENVIDKVGSFLVQNTNPQNMSQNKYSLLGYCSDDWVINTFYKDDPEGG